MILHHKGFRIYIVVSCLKEVYTILKCVLVRQNILLGIKKSIKYYYLIKNANKNV